MRLSVLALLALGAPADAPRLTLDLNCPGREDPGRVVCDVEIQGQQNQRMVWADALVVRAPTFVKPLRSRVTAPLVPQGDATLKLSVALLASGPGRAEVGIRVRAVLCSIPPRNAPRLCTTAHGDVSAVVSIGPEVAQK